MASLAYRYRVVYPTSDMKARQKDPLAVALGSRGGKARKKNMSKPQRVESARKASVARWDAVRLEREKGLAS